MSLIRRPVLFIAASLAVAVLATSAPVGAEIYTVVLKSGNSFDSRYPPRTASYDANVVLMLTEWGNWVAIDRADIDDITTQTQAKGYGTVIDTNTFSLGFMANDKLTPEEEAERAAADPMAAFRAALPKSENYSIEQFAEPSNTQGIPTSMVGSSSAVDFFGGGNRAPAPPPPAPVPSPAP